MHPSWKYFHWIEHDWPCLCLNVEKKIISGTPNTSNGLMENPWSPDNFYGAVSIYSSNFIQSFLNCSS